MQNLNNALFAAGFGNINVSTAVKMSVLAFSSPPSSGAFADPSVMGPIVGLLASTGSPLLANIYPYFNGDVQRELEAGGGDGEAHWSLQRPGQVAGVRY
ncbi:hypothetical protein BAE44_0006336 [Dichanthelium oligosanthes]|uniref:Uncharacterized protein n=1 Tax=Dichanthelium oligosanthes TaxID=888268 RepID=A0A1E5W5K0_9POAL|nr:hypothetical protein BAE44_0006336 [Dichanthelium oligosanthes]